MSSYLCDLDSFLCAPCDIVEHGRVSGVAFVQRGAPLPNPSSVQDWVNLVCNNLAIIIPAVRGTYDGSSPSETTGYGRIPTFRTGATHEVQYFHLWQCDNVNFYNTLMRLANDYTFWFATGSKLHKGGRGVYLSVQTPVSDDVASAMEFQVTVRWSNYELPQCYELPGQIFESCEALRIALQCNRCFPITSFPCAG